MTIRNVSPEKPIFKVRSYAENNEYINVEVQLNKSMFIEGRLQVYNFANDLKAFIKAISDWHKTSRKKSQVKEN
jgi:hypothetical protein